MLDNLTEINDCGIYYLKTTDFQTIQTERHIILMIYVLIIMQLYNFNLL